jgi:hypothetical protein
MTTHHSLHVLDGAAMSEMRKMVTSMKGSITGPKARKPFDELMEKVPAASGATYEAAPLDGVRACGAEPPFLITRIVVVLAFVALGIFAVRLFLPEPRARIESHIDAHKAFR